MIRRITTLTFRQWLILWLCVGLGLRLVITVKSGWRIDFDEAFNGLLAFDIQRGEFPLFTPPEVVGGTGSPYLLAFLFWLLGASAFTFRLLSFIWSALYIITMGYLARAAYGQRVAIIAMACASLAPPYMQFVGMKLWSSYIETIVLGHMLLLIAYHLLQATDRRFIIRWMMGLGLVGGVMFWLTWLGFYYVVPVGLVLLWRGRRHLLRWGWLGGLAFLLGSAPFWIFNIPRGMPTLTRVAADAPMTLSQIRDVLIDFVTIRLPMLVTGHPSWGYEAVGIAIIMTSVYVVGLCLVIYRARDKQSLAVMLALLIVSIPCLYALSTHSRNALPDFNPWGIDATGRYILMLHSLLPIGLALLIHQLWAWRKRVTWGLMVLVLSINVIGTLSVNPHRAFDSPYYDRLPHDLSPLINFLEERHIRYAWVDGGIGHVLMFLTHERVLTEDYHSVFLSGGLVRQPDVLSDIQSASPTVFITPIYSEQQNPPLQQSFDRQQILYEMVRVTPQIAVYIVDSQFDPMQIADGLGYQY